MYQLLCIIAFDEHLFLKYFIIQMAVLTEAEKIMHKHWSNACA